MSPRLVMLLACTAVALTACGKQGRLDRPPPLWGTQNVPPPPQTEKKTERPSETSTPTQPPRPTP